MNPSKKRLFNTRIVALWAVQQGAVAASCETKLWQWSKNNEDEFTMPTDFVFSRFTDLFLFCKK
jgi:hypothetical protein